MIVIINNTFWDLFLVFVFKHMYLMNIFYKKDVKLLLNKSGGYLDDKTTSEYNIQIV